MNTHSAQDSLWQGGAISKLARRAGDILPGQSDNRRRDLHRAGRGTEKGG